MKATSPSWRERERDVDEEQEQEQLLPSPRDRGGGRRGPPPPALGVPADVISRVFSQLDCVDLLSCSLVCKQWYRDSSHLRQGWKSEYMAASALFCSGIKRHVHPPSSTCSIRGLHSWCP
ncbi:F-box/SPRY domain-containing protein 1 [Rhynchospora pubera]|uniref:F-box/SPRY domain-containing protein 1 n=1 Tax=Rhynchospora pubera TaxID=906938 RepID=A0AAV8CRF7_9POAL|nr:F-box/SPRY domain-containing protein 1 [Rhynchospora pubera]